MPIKMVDSYVCVRVRSGPRNKGAVQTAGTEANGSHEPKTPESGRPRAADREVGPRASPLRRAGSAPSDHALSRGLPALRRHRGYAYSLDRAAPEQRVFAPSDPIAAARLARHEIRTRRDGLGSGY